MKRYVENKIRQWLGEDNPSFLWLAYLLPFGLPIVNAWGKGVVAGWVLLDVYKRQEDEGKVHVGPQGPTRVLGASSRT